MNAKLLIQIKFIWADNRIKLSRNENISANISINFIHPSNPKLKVFSFDIQYFLFGFESLSLNIKVIAAYEPFLIQVAIMGDDLLCMCYYNRILPWIHFSLGAGDHICSVEPGTLQRKEGRQIVPTDGNICGERMTILLQAAACCLAPLGCW